MSAIALVGAVAICSTPALRRGKLGAGEPAAIAAE
jgi:hypothetical protein